MCRRNPGLPETGNISATVGNLAYLIAHLGREELGFGRAACRRARRPEVGPAGRGEWPHPTAGGGRRREARRRLLRPRLHQGSGSGWRQTAAPATAQPAVVGCSRSGEAGSGVGRRQKAAAAALELHQPPRLGYGLDRPSGHGGGRGGTGRRRGVSGGRRRSTPAVPSGGGAKERETWCLGQRRAQVGRRQAEEAGAARGDGGDRRGGSPDGLGCRRGRSLGLEALGLDLDRERVKKKMMMMWR